MEDRDKGVKELPPLRAKLFTLAVLNVLQPVDLEGLAEYLRERFDKVLIKQILDVLLKEGRVIQDQGRYRLSYVGLSSVARGRGRRLIDIARMKRLARIQDSAGGGSS